MTFKQLVLQILTASRGRFVSIETLRDAVYAGRTVPAAWDANVRHQIDQVRARLPAGERIVCRDRAYCLEDGDPVKPVRLTSPHRPQAAAPVKRVLPQRHYGDLQPRAGR